MAGAVSSIVTEQEIRLRTLYACEEFGLKDKNVLVIIPDNTRTAPIAAFFKIFGEVIVRRAKKLDYLIALGTHPYLSEREILERIGINVEEKKLRYCNVNIYNHEWRKKSTFYKLGRLLNDDVLEATNGLIDKSIDIYLNKLILEYDVLIVVGPVYPHEFVGFSGGNKYFFPGICGWNFIDLTHWTAALSTNLKTIGIRDTPVRNLIEKAASLIDRPVIYFNLVMEQVDLKGLFIGNDKQAWDSAVNLSEKTNIRYLSRKMKKVLSIPASHYTEFWTGAKAIYKVEPIVEDGGELVVYAPAIKHMSKTHDDTIGQIGFHVKDYFISNIKEYRNISKTVLAYCSYIKGAGSYQNGIEKTRINVKLSTGIRKEYCEKLGISYIDPKEIDISSWKNKQNDGIIIIESAGEVLYKVSENA